MAAVQMTKELRELKKVLTNLSCSETQLKSAILKLANVLYSSAQSLTTLGHLQQLAFQIGIVKALLGIMGSSSEPSILSKAAGCVALLSHGYEDGRTWLGEMGAIPILVDLLSPLSLEGSDVCWHYEWIKVYEQSLIALRKLTYMNEDNQQQLAIIGGIKLIIEISMHDKLLSNFSTFPQEAKTELETLVLKKKLVARVTSASGGQKDGILSHFSSLNQGRLVIATHYPAFNVSLVTNDNIPVSDVLIQRGVVWPHPSHTLSDTKLTRVTVMCVEDGGHVWCDFNSGQMKENLAIMRDSLKNMPPPTPGTLSHPLLTAGDVYAAYFDPSMFPDLLPFDVPQWVRVRLLSVEAAKVELTDTNTVQVLAVDFGFTTTVSSTQVTGLPPECRGIPPQAIPCKLTGVQPPPASLAMLENAAAVLRNVAFEKLLFRKEIMSFGGTEALVKMVNYPCKPAVLQALGALLNMAVSKQLRTEMGKKGAIQTLLDICKGWSSDVEILEQVVSCLFNLVVGCHDNITIVTEADGDRILTDLYSNKLVPHKVLQSLSKILQSLPSHRSCEVGVTTTGPFQQVKRDSQYRAKKRANGERTPSRPVRHVLDSDSDCEDERVVTCEAGAGVGLEHDDKDVSSGAISLSKSYTVDRQLPLHEDNKNSFVAVDSIEDLPSSLLRRTVCAFINTGQLCTMYIGVQKEGVVKGVKVDKKQRDLLIVAIDNLMSGFTPKIHHTQYSVLFVPVYGRGQRSLVDVFVVEVCVKESVFHQIYTTREKDKWGDVYERCYYRIGPFNEQLSFQELRDIVTQEEGGRYESEMNALEMNIQRLKTAVGKTAP